VLHQVGSAEEAIRARQVGVDVIIAQGVEAGGHVAGQVSTMVLVPRIVDAVAPALVLAAGGVADARGLAAALCLGADGVVMGTR
jgi:nitronate monooxygenase